MTYQSFRSASAVVDPRPSEARARTCSSLCDFGAERHDWLSRRGRRLLGRSSHLLLAASEHLQRWSSTQGLPLQGQMQGIC